MSDDYELKKEFLRKWLIVVSRSGKFSTIFNLIILSLALGTFITLFLGDTYNFLNQCLVTPCSWMAAGRLFVFKLEFPNSRVIRWIFRLVLLMSVIHTILLVNIYENYIVYLHVGSTHAIQCVCCTRMETL